MQTTMTTPTTKKMKYQRLVDRSKELSSMYKEKMNFLLSEGKNMQDIDRNRELTEMLMEGDCLSHVFECGGIDKYQRIADFCKELGVKRVFDIGCAYGHQSEVFLKEDLDYVGINRGKHTFWNEDKFTYITGLYPMKLDTKSEDLGVSVLCLTWNCYLLEGEKTLKEQCEALQRDFEHCILYAQKDNVEFVSRYFKRVENIKGNLFYFSNK